MIGRRQSVVETPLITMATTRSSTAWRIDYDDPGPIRIRDPVAEALGVLEPGDPIVIDYRSLLTHTGHSCPAAAGAYRISLLGLDALYEDTFPKRGEVAVTAAGAPDQHPYGVISEAISHVTGAADDRGFPGLGDGFGDRRHRLTFDGFEAAGIGFEFADADTGEAVRVTYHLDEVPRPEELGLLPEVLDGSADAAAMEAFRTAWHDRVRRVLHEEEFFTVESVATS